VDDLQEPAMTHVLAKLKDVNYHDVREILRTAAPSYVRQGLFLEHVWRDTGNADNVVVLFRTDDLGKAKQVIADVNAEAHEETLPSSEPEVDFLEER
jgi:hypothetical protein